MLCTNWVCVNYNRRVASLGIVSRAAGCSDRCPSAPTCRASSSWAPGPSSSARRPSSTTAARRPCAPSAKRATARPGRQQPGHHHRGTRRGQPSKVGPAFPLRMIGGRVRLCIPGLRGAEGHRTHIDVADHLHGTASARTRQWTSALPLFTLSHSVSWRGTPAEPGMKTRGAHGHWWKWKRFGYSGGGVTFGSGTGGGGFIGSMHRSARNLLSFDGG